MVKEIVKEMVKEMLGKAIEIGVRAVMENNIYRFGGEIRRQSKGGAIGVKMTGNVWSLSNLVIKNNIILVNVWDLSRKTKGAGLLHPVIKCPLPNLHHRHHHIDVGPTALKRHLRLPRVQRGNLGRP